MCLVFKQVFDLAEEAFTLLIILFVGILFKFLQKLFLALAQVFGTSTVTRTYWSPRPLPLML